MSGGGGSYSRVASSFLLQKVAPTNFLMKVSCQDEFASGTFLQAKAEAFTMKSLTDNFTFSLSRDLLSWPRSLCVGVGVCV